MVQSAHEIDYQIYGDDMQFVEIGLDPGEAIISEAGAMMYMTDGIEMQTVFGDPSKDQGFIGKLFESEAVNVFRALRPSAIETRKDVPIPSAPPSRLCFAQMSRRCEPPAARTVGTGARRCPVP